MSTGELEARADQARRWLFDAMFPLWSSAGFDVRAGQFVEQLTQDGEPDLTASRRVLVQARQLYVFARAGRMGWDGPWRAVIEAAAATLLARGRTDDGDWIFAFDGAGRPSDRRLDCYTQAFAILGLTHAGVALERPDLLAAARATRDRLDRAWREPSGGFREGELYPSRRQNPHMHLFEAMMALCEAGGEPVDFAMAGELWALFKTRFHTDGGVLEYFDAALRPLNVRDGQEVWPGHAFEWSWLANRWRTIGGADAATLADQLHHTGRRGLDAGGRACDEARMDGRVKLASARLWPQTEHLKSALVHDERSGTGSHAADAVAAYEALSRYFDGVRPGLWRDRWLAEGGWAPGPAPASSGYHIVCALEELIRAAAN